VTSATGGIALPSMAAPRWQIARQNPPVRLIYPPDSIGASSRPLRGIPRRVKDGDSQAFKDTCLQFLFIGRAVALSQAEI